MVEATLPWLSLFRRTWMAGLQDDRHPQHSNRWSRRGAPALEGLVPEIRRAREDAGWRRRRSRCVSQDYSWGADSKVAAAPTWKASEHGYQRPCRARGQSSVL